MKRKEFEYVDVFCISGGEIKVLTEAEFDKEVEVGKNE